MKVLNPSSIQAWRRSLLPTIIGNHSWPCSCAMVPKTSCSLPPPCTMTNIGYSIPPTGPATLVACGYG